MENEKDCETTAQTPQGRSNKPPPDKQTAEGDGRTCVYTATTEDAAANVSLRDDVVPLDRDSFPHQPRTGSVAIPATIPNVEWLLQAYGISVRYNTIKKKQHIVVPGQRATPDNADNVAISHVLSLANLNAMHCGAIMNFVAVVADKNPYNPAAEWIMSRPWDGKDRLEEFYSTLVQREGYPEELKRTLMYRWLVSAVAAALMPSGFRARGVLTLQGPQAIGKTAWVRVLVPDPLSEELVKIDHHLDAGDKDSLITAISHWIVEIGELDSSFRRDVARLKGFLTRDRDKVRRPYGRADSEYPRRTVFCATVNDANFLVDSTGNSRFWVVPVVAVNYDHNVDTQQLFRQLVLDYHSGERWWLTRDEEVLLESHNRDHRAVSATREQVIEELDLERIGEHGLPAMTPTAVLKAIGIERPSNPQCRECGAVLRELVGEPRRIQGLIKWRVPLKKPSLRGSRDDRDKEY